MSATAAKVLVSISVVPGKTTLHVTDPIPFSGDTFQGARALTTIEKQRMLEAAIATKAHFGRQRTYGQHFTSQEVVGEYVSQLNGMFLCLGSRIVVEAA